MPLPLKRIRKRAIRWLEATATHDEIYDAAYYHSLVDPTMERSATVMATSIVRDLSPLTAVDVGCGTGLLLLALRRLGVSASGLEHSAAAIQICKRRGIDVRELDIETGSTPELVADIAVSTEVAEHLPASCADRFVQLLCELAPTVILTAAEPSGETGTDHVNEQPQQYWIQKFAARGYTFNETMSRSWRGNWRQQGVAGCFWSTVMVLRRDFQ